MSQNQESIQQLGKLIHDIQIAMLTTIEADGTVRSRPMATQREAFDGALWFFTRASSPKVDEAQQHEQVGVSYADPEKNRYVSVSGTAQLVKDPAELKAKWSPAIKAWFPKGVEDPELALLKITVDQAEYWDAPSSKMVQLVGFVKAIATGQPLQGQALGDHGRVRIH